MQFEDLIQAMNRAGCYSLDDYRKVGTVFSFAEHHHHKGAPRKSGDPYITHPIAVAIKLANSQLDVDTICAGLLHDTVEDIPGITDQLIEEQFGPVVSSLVAGVTKIRKNENEDEEYNRDANIKKIVESITKDIRIMNIKLADREHNMETMEYMKAKKRESKSMETKDVYVPIATLLGEYKMKTNFEDLSFKYTQPDDYEEMSRIAKEVEITKQHTKDIILTSTTKMLLDSGLIPRFDARIKNLYGIYRRLQKYGSVDKIHDLIAIKIILDDVEKLYSVRKKLLQVFEEVEGKSKDYIISPKTNEYRALHSTIIAPDGSMVQLQFVTPTMDNVNMYGISAAYQELRKKGDTNIKDLQERVSNMPFYKTLQYFREADLTPNEYVKAIKHDVLTKMIYVEDTNKKVIELPYGSTPIDYALETDPKSVHNVWKILVNGQSVGPDYQLESKDTIRIVKAYEEKDAIPMRIIASNASNYKSQLKIKELNLR